MRLIPSAIPSSRLTTPLLRVKVTIEGQSGVETKSLPLLKKTPEIGEKTTVYGPEILLEKEDAASLEDQEEVSPHTELFETSE